MSFISKYCPPRNHCHVCRSDSDWRTQTGAPDLCPHGVTTETLPKRSNSTPMNIIRDTNTVPDDGWQYPAIVGPPIYTRNYSIFYGLVREHYEANGVPPPSEQQVIDYCCEQLGAPCYDSETHTPLITRFTSGLPAPAKGCCGK